VSDSIRCVGFVLMCVIQKPTLWSYFSTNMVYTQQALVMSTQGSNWNQIPLRH
jgi:hypothetical protein